MKQLFVTCILSCAILLQAVAQQNLTGRWQWTIQGSGGDIQTDYLIEFDLKQEGNRLYGLRTLYLRDFDDVVINVEGFVGPNGDVTISSKNVVQCNLPDSILIAKNFTYKLHKDSISSKKLSGTFYPREDTSKLYYRSASPELYESIFLHSFSSPFKKLADTLSEKAKKRMGIAEVATAKPKAPPVVLDVQARLTLPATNISIDLYDNGEIDGDTISLIVNNKEVVTGKRLSTRAVHFDLKLEDFSDTTTVVMRAENLGSIPPNTALMLITAAGKRYDVRLSSDLKKQGTVILYKQH